MNLQDEMKKGLFIIFYIEEVLISIVKIILTIT